MYIKTERNNEQLSMSKISSIQHYESSNSMSLFDKKYRHNRC